ncbi:MAG: hypothetical protein C4519_04150 [Desulfobacteraceae bacterium]|nr:MAG: hypothetical protein C4519_04150 [Desulfobacteraceae bacterium]
MSMLFASGHFGAITVMHLIGLILPRGRSKFKPSKVDHVPIDSQKWVGGGSGEGRNRKHAALLRDDYTLMLIEFNDRSNI